MHQVEMTPKEQETVLEKARSLSEFFREIGPKCDEVNAFPKESIQPFKDSGLGALPVPKKYGGLGGDILTTSKVVTEMSRGDSAIALAYNMHYIMVGLLMNLMSEEQNAYWLGRIINGDIVFGPFSEARAGFSGLAEVKAIPQPEGGWRLYGKKTWGTLSEAADIIMTTATITDADGNIPKGFEEWINAESVFINDFDVDEYGQGDGIRIERTWNALGMHATGTQFIYFDGYYIPQDGYVCEWRSGAFGALEWASVLFASLYYGMQLRIFEEARAVLAEKHLGATFGAVVATDTAVAKIGHIIDGIGDMAARCELSRRVLYQTCNDLLTGYDDDWPAELRVPYIGLAKIFVAENVTYMSRRAMSMVGGSSFRHGTIFERLYRDSAAAMFQPLNADQTYTYIGEYMLQPDELAE
jgi:alkylation response protein AidB-like acyl-CoA dehydrogenase